MPAVIGRDLQTMRPTRLGHAGQVDDKRHIRADVFAHLLAVDKDLRAEVDPSELQLDHAPCPLGGHAHVPAIRHMILNHDRPVGIIYQGFA